MEERIVIAGSGTHTQVGMLQRWLIAIRQDIAALRKYRYVLRNLVATDLQVRYQRSALGFLWSLLNPLLMLGVLAFFLSHVVRGVDNYALYLFSGLVPWMFFQQAVMDGCRALIAHEALIKKVSVHKLVFPLSTILVSAVNMAFTMVALFLLLKFVGAKLTLPMVVLPGSIVLLVVFSMGVALISMTLVTYFRDFEHITNVGLQALYFATPILYPPHLLGNYEWVLQYNPLTHLLELFQAPIYRGEWPTAHSWLLSLAMSIIVVLTGYIVFKKREHDYIYRL